MSVPRPLLGPPPPPVRGCVGIVGVCASGKSTLERGLSRLGYNARQCGQEHSYIPDMWRRLTRPEVLIYLDASPRVARRRRDMRLRGSDHAAQRERLAHAREHCHVYIDTDAFSRQQVLEEAVRALCLLLPGFAGADATRPSAASVGLRGRPAVDDLTQRVADL